MLMKKVLRFSWLCMLFMLCGNLMAQTTVTLDFDNDYQSLFPTLAGVSSSDSNAGDFTEATMSTPVGGVMVMVSPDEDAATPSRIWTSTPRLRMYSGSFSVIGSGITKIEFTGHNTNFNLTAHSGTLNGKTWTGNEDIVMFLVQKNTQINKIVVTMDGEGYNDDDDDDEGLVLTDGTIHETENQIVLDFTATYSERQYEVDGQMIFDFVDNACTHAVTIINFPTAQDAQEAYGQFQEEADDEDYDSLELEGKTITVGITSQFAGYSKAMVKKMLSFILDDEYPFGTGTLQDPFSAVDANLIGKMMLEEGETSEIDYYIKGKVSSIKYTFSAQYGTATFYISEDGTPTDQFYCYGTYYLENKPWVEGYTQIKEGDEVIVCGRLTNYRGTIETANKQAFLYSLNGQTKAENIDNPNPQVELITVAKALEIIDALENGKTTAQSYQVRGLVTSISEISTQYGNATFVMADNAAEQTGLTVYRAKGFGNEKITDENLFHVGDEVVVEGKLQKYVKNGEVIPELSSCYFISIGGNSHINALTTSQNGGDIYSLSGQRVEKMQRGIYIKNGRKVLVK